MDSIEGLNFNRRKTKNKSGEEKPKKKRKNKAVILIDQNGEKHEFETITAAGKYLGKSIDSMSKAMKRGETIFGYKWKWSEGDQK